MVYPAILGANLPSWFKIWVEGHLQVRYNDSVTWVLNYVLKCNAPKNNTFSPTSSLALACTRKHEIIPFHKHLRQIIQSSIFSCPDCVKSSFNQGYFLTIYVVHDNLLVAIKIDSCCTIRNMSIETSMRKVLLSTSCIYYAYIWFLKVLFRWQSLILFIMYYTLSRTLFTGTKSTFIRDLMLPDRERYSSRHHARMRPLYRCDVSPLSKDG
jgi:hypothetical protein